LDIKVFCNLLRVPDPTVYQMGGVPFTQFRVPTRPAILKWFFPKFDTCPVRNLMNPTGQGLFRTDNRRNVRLLREYQIAATLWQRIVEFLKTTFEFREQGNLPLVFPLMVFRLRRMYPKPFPDPINFRPPQEGIVFVAETIHDPSGDIVEVVLEKTPTLLAAIPVSVFINDGLTGDTDGESEIALLEDFESWHSRMSNADIDAGRANMNPILGIHNAESYLFRQGTEEQLGNKMKKAVNGYKQCMQVPPVRILGGRTSAAEVVRNSLVEKSLREVERGRGKEYVLQGGWFILVTFTQGGGICVEKHSRLALG